MDAEDNNGGEGKLDGQMEAERTLRFVAKLSHEAKLRQLMYNITSTEIRLCSAGSKEFIKLLSSDEGGELLHQYVHMSSKCSELVEAWKIRREKKDSLSYILRLISTILNHSEGKYKPNDAERIVVSRVLDKFAQLIIEEKLGDLYKELNSKEGKRQNSALMLLASIVGRGSGLASAVAKTFDFKLPVFGKLAEYKSKPVEKKKHSTRKSFVWFAMSFLEVGQPGLLRWVLQQKEMYSGVLRGLGNDDYETVEYVLSTLRDRVLTPESLVPPGLRSVLFGSVTLEQLVSISGRDDGGSVAELSHMVLLKVCTDPSNGLMPDAKAHPNPLKGNPLRLLGAMKKLRATEVYYHKELLLAIVKGRPGLGSLYMEEFPYNLEDHASPMWLAAISLASDLVSSVGTDLSFSFLNSHDLPSRDNSDIQSMLRCITPRPFGRSIINKGLLHSNFLVKNGTLRLLLEVLKLLDSFVDALNTVSCSDTVQSWASFKQEIRNEVRTVLPDPQVLLTLLSPLSSQSKARQLSLKRDGHSQNFPMKSSRVKRPKTNMVDEDADIVVGGINPDMSVSQDGTTTVLVNQPGNENDQSNVIREIWGLHQCPVPRDEEIFFYSKLLDALKIYLRTVPNLLEGSFEFFVNLLGSRPPLPTSLLPSLMSLLIEYIGLTDRNNNHNKVPSLMYKHLQLFINLTILSPISEIRNQARCMAEAAMLSTGAFDRNLPEVSAWFLFLPGFSGDKSFFDFKEVEVFQSLSPVVVKFLCDAVSTTANSLFKYLDLMRCHICSIKGVTDTSPSFSPLLVCALLKCLRLLNSESGNSTIPEKTMISLYVCNTIRFLLETQVDAGLLSSLVNLVLSEGLQDQTHVIDDSSSSLCEWRPLKDLLLLSQEISECQAGLMFVVDRGGTHSDSSFTSTLDEVKRMSMIGCDDRLMGITKAFYSSIICTTSDVIIRNFPSFLTISQSLLGVPFSLLSSLIFLERNVLDRVSKLWPDIFFPALEMVVSRVHHEGSRNSSSNMSRHFTSAEGVMNINTLSRETISSALGLFLEMTPFHVLFPAIISIDGFCLLEPSKIQDILLAKLCESSVDYIISSLRLVLFWFLQIRSSYKIKPSVQLVKLSGICFDLIECMLVQFLVQKCDSGRSTYIGALFSRQIVNEVAETIFLHPAIINSLVSPLESIDKSRKNTGDNMETSYLSIKETERSSQSVGVGIHEMDNHVTRILSLTSKCLLSLFSSQYISPAGDAFVSKSLKKFKVLLFKELKNRFDGCIKTGDWAPFVPILHVLLGLVHTISPFELLPLVHWMFDRVEEYEIATSKSCNAPALIFCFDIASNAFKMLSNYLKLPYIKGTTDSLFWKTEEPNFDILLFEKVYVKVLKFCTCLELESAFLCILKAVYIVCRQKFTEHQHVHPLSLVISRVIVRTPTELVSQCFSRTCMTKGKLLFHLTEVSPMHLSVFGNLFTCILDAYKLNEDLVKQISDNGLSVNDFLILLPTALSYLNYGLMKLGKEHCERFRSIPTFYSKILLTGFADWDNYVSGDIFQMDHDELFTSSAGDLSNVCNDSLLGKAIRMLQYHLSLSEKFMESETRLKIFYLVCPLSTGTDEMLGCDTNEMESFSCGQSSNMINRVVARVSLCRMLLFPGSDIIPFLPKKADGELNEIHLERECGQEELSKLHFVKMLVSSWQLIVKRFFSHTGSSIEGKPNDCLQEYKFLETFFLKTIVEITKQVNGMHFKLQCIPFVEQVMRTSLLHKFEDATTLKMLQKVLLATGGKKLCGIVLQLLLAHSQFSSTIQLVPKSHVSSCIGAFLRPVSSILRSLIAADNDQAEIDNENDKGVTELSVRKLEVIKLLRILVHFKAHQCEKDSERDNSVNYRELLWLLLSSYSATLDETDIELCDLLHELEASDGLDSGNIAEMDYLWGTAVLKIRELREREQNMPSGMTTGDAAHEETRKSQFRENLPIDPKICVNTALYFPHERTLSCLPLFANKLPSDTSKDTKKIHSRNLIIRYDPVFILRFSIHSLSKGYIEPVEFAGLGLLAIAFASLSSHDEGIRKLGYETLASFKCVLEKCQKRKDVTRLRLLLSHMQNGVEEPWQRIPSVVAIYAAEASFILLDASNDLYSAISKILTASSRANMKSIPLFDNYFWSSSVSFKNERLWILRLAYSGLCLDDDAHIYKRVGTFENLLSFYSSSLSDDESNQLILQIVRKSAKLHKMAHYLVEKCSLLSWLSSQISLIKERLHSDKRRYLSVQLVMVVEVANEVLLSRNTTEWLQKYALEQLMELSSHLYELLASGMVSAKENVGLVNSILQILTSTAKISQKRKMYQPHFTLSMEGFFRIYRVVSVLGNGTCNPTAAFGLRAILMSTPDGSICQMRQEKLSEFVLWAISIAMQSDFEITSQSMSFYSDVPLEKELCVDEESLVLKLLRWLTAAAIVGKLSQDSNDVVLNHLEKTNTGTLHSLLEYIGGAYGQPRSKYGCEYMLPAAILYLQQLLGKKCSVLPSVVSALCLLLLSDSSSTADLALNLQPTSGISIASLLSRIRCPPETNSSWRWSFYQPWKDLTLQPQTDTERLDELHACETLLVIVSNVLENRDFLFPLGLDSVFEWERNILKTKLF